MSIKVDLVGRRSEPTPFEYTFRDTILYALGVGAKVDELDYLYEGRGPKVLPTFAVVPSFSAMVSVVAELGANPLMVVHGEQGITLYRPIPPQGKLSTVSEVKGIYDKGKGALVLVEARTVDAKGAPVFDNHFSIFVRGAGGFGGERGPEGRKAEPPQGQVPDFEVIERTSPEQALLYRLSGDLNPLHADPGLSRMAGFDRPLLHGLCTFGHAGRAILRSACGGDGDLLRSFSARFAQPVFPGDTLTTRGWRLPDGKYVVRMFNQDGKEVLSNALAEVVERAAGP